MNAFGPYRTFIEVAANGGLEPILPKAAQRTDVGNAVSLQANGCLLRVSRALAGPRVSGYPIGKCI